MVDFQSVAAEIRRGIKKDRRRRRRRKKPQGKNIMSASAMQGSHNNQAQNSDLLSGQRHKRPAICNRRHPRLSID